MSPTTPFPNLHETWILANQDTQVTDPQWVDAFVGACSESSGAAQVSQRLQRMLSEPRDAVIQNAPDDLLTASLNRLAALLATNAGSGARDHLGQVDRELLDAVAQRLPSPLADRARSILESHPTTDDTTPSRRIIGRYELLGPLGSGASGVVYRARHRNSGHLAALKLVRLDTLSAAQVERFRKEARIVGALSHPGIVSILDSGMHDDGALQLPWIATELVDGTRFSAEALGNVRERVLAAIAALCDAMAHAHERGVLHRDLKPANVLLDEDGNPHVVDFGIARMAGAENRRPTLSGDQLGTPAYMAPEVARWGATAASVASDVWSLGAMLHEALSGQMLFDLDDVTPQHALLRVAETTPRRLATICPDVPPDLAAIVATATAPEPERRYGSAAELRDDLHRFLAGHKVEVRPPSVIDDAVRFTRRHRGLVRAVALILFATVAGGIAAFALWQRAAEAESRHLEAANRAKSAVSGSLDALVAATRLAAELGAGAGDSGRIRELVTSPLDLLDSLAANDEGPESERWARVEAALRLVAGDAAVRQGDWVSADVQYERVLEIERERSAGLATPLRNLAQARVKCGSVAKERSRSQEMVSLFTEAHQIYLVRHENLPDDEDPHDDLCWSLERMAFVDIEVLGKPERGLMRCGDRLKLARDGSARWPGFKSSHNLTAALLRLIDTANLHDPEWQPSPKLAREALDIVTVKRRRWPDHRPLQILQVEAHRSIANEHRVAGRWLQAVRAIDIAANLASKLVNSDPIDHEYGEVAVKIWCERAQLHAQFERDPSTSLLRLVELLSDARWHPSPRTIASAVALIDELDANGLGAHVRTLLPAGSFPIKK
ncbi:MAG: hypothetical protein ACI89X_003337 [Planctomycetota bacterium]|jgi:hypothetical protein